MHLENITDHDQSKTSAENDPARKECVVNLENVNFASCFFFS